MDTFAVIMIFIVLVGAGSCVNEVTNRSFCEEGKVQIINQKAYKCVEQKVGE